MSSLVLVHLDNLFYGIKRMTGDPAAKPDYVRLKQTLQAGSDDLWMAYVVMPIAGKTRIYDDRRFVTFMTDRGYKIRRIVAPVTLESYGRSQVDSPVVRTAMRAAMESQVAGASGVGRLLVLSGAAVAIPAATLARSRGWQVDVACFTRSGDLHPDLRVLAHRVIALGPEFRYQKKGHES